jgi:hypothetical protein
MTAAIALLLFSPPDVRPATQPRGCDSYVGRTPVRIQHEQAYGVKGKSEQVFAPNA